jgi:hypothetical protein
MLRSRTGRPFFAVRIGPRGGDAIVSRPTECVMKRIVQKSSVGHEVSNEAATVATSASVPVVPTVGTPTTAPPTSTGLGDVPLQLQAIEARCGYGEPLTNADRRTSLDLVRRVPSTIVDRVIALAVRGGGKVAEIGFDPSGAKSALAAADEADAIAQAAQMLARRAQDQSIRLRSTVSGNAAGIRIALRGYAKTAQGKSLQSENDEIRTLAKQHAAAAKSRKTRAEKAAADAGGAAAGGAEVGAVAGAPVVARPPVPAVKGS